MRLRSLVVLISALASAACTLGAPAGEPAPGRKPGEGGQVWRGEGSPDEGAPAAAPATAHGRLYVVGGDDGDALTGEATVWSAAIAADGTLATFREESHLPAPRSGHALVVHGDRLLVVGGSEGGEARREVLEATADDEGKLSAWREVEGLRAPNAAPAAVVDGSRVLVLGGRDEAGPSAGVSMADLQGGVLGQFHETKPMPESRARFGLARLGPFFVAIGGEDGAGAVGDVLVGSVDQGTGAPGEWASASPLPQPTVDHAVTAVGDRLYVVGGFTSRAERGVYFTSADDHGALARWEATAPLPSGRSKHCVAATGSFVFAVGGVGGESPRALAEVLVASIRTDGTLSDWKHVASLPRGRASLGCVIR